jgi:hypothetical protein
MERVLKMVKLGADTLAANVTNQTTTIFIFNT